MKYQLVLTNRSVTDIEKAKAWYDKQQKGLGNKFADAVFKSIESVQSNPLKGMRLNTALPKKN